MMMRNSNLIRLLAVTAWMMVLPADVVPAFQEMAVPPAASVTDIKVSFKLDPRITQGMYMGELWVSPPVYTRVGKGKELTVEARVHGIDAKGKPINIRSKWMPSDPEMVAVSRGQGDDVKITVHRAGQCSLEVTSQGFSRKLSVKARYEGSAIQVEIFQ
jgi:hypothetical protein